MCAHYTRPTPVIESVNDLMSDHHTDAAKVHCRREEWIVEDWLQYARREDCHIL
jgi:hypothetical protein